jgi:hypothetical protein
MAVQRVAAAHEDDRDCRRAPLNRLGREPAGNGENHFGMEVHQLLDGRGEATGIATGRPRDHPQVAPFGPSELCHCLPECGDLALIGLTVLGAERQHPDLPQALALLRAGRERPNRRAAKCGCELSSRDDCHPDRLPISVVWQRYHAPGPSCTGRNHPP